jgi:hypothetical protein
MRLWIITARDCRRYLASLRVQHADTRLPAGSGMIPSMQQAATGAVRVRTSVSFPVGFR